MGKGIEGMGPGLSSGIWMCPVPTCDQPTPATIGMLQLVTG